MPPQSSARHDHVMNVEVFYGVGVSCFFSRNEHGDVSSDEEGARHTAHQDRRASHCMRRRVFGLPISRGISR